MFDNDINKNTIIWKYLYFYYCIYYIMYCKHNAPEFHPLGNINVKANKFMVNVHKCKQNITEKGYPVENRNVSLGKTIAEYT